MINISLLLFELNDPMRSFFSSVLRTLLVLLLYLCFDLFIYLFICLFIFYVFIYSPHHCGVFVFLLASRLPPSVVRRRPPRASHLTPLISHNSSHTIHLTHNSSHTIHLTQFISHNSSHTQLISHNSSHTQFISHNSSHTPLISHNSSHTTHLTHNSSHTQLISHTTHLTHNSSQLISHNSSHTTHLTHLISQTCCLAGAVHRAFWRRCGADWRRSGRGYLLRGRRTTESLLKELRRGLAPQWPRLLVAWQAQYTEPFWRSCGADWRRRGRGCVLCSRRSTQSLLQELRRGLAPQWPRLLVAWQAQYKEPPEGAAARIGAAVAAAACCVAGAVRRACYRSCGADWRRSGRGYLLRGRRSTESLLKELRRGLAPQWPRLVVAWQAQYSELPEGAAARIGAAVAAAACCMAGAVHTASWRSCGAWPRLACRLCYIGVCRRGVCVTDMPLRSYIGVGRGGVSVTDLCRRSYIGVCRGGVCVGDLRRRRYISHHSSHTTHLTPLISHNSSHTTHLTQLILHHSSHTPHLTPLISHHEFTPLISHNSSHTTHLTPLISNHSSHTTNSHN